MPRRRTFYIVWGEHHPNTDYSHPLAFAAVLAVNIDVARAAATDQVGAEGWELQIDPPGPRSLYPLGCQAVLDVVDETSTMFIRRESGRFEPEPQMAGAL